MTAMLGSAPVIVLVFLVTRQLRGGLAALLGVLVAVVFLAGGLAIMNRYVVNRAASTNPLNTNQLNTNPLSVVARALALYCGQLVFLGVVILTLSGAHWLDGTAFGLSVLAVALIWQLSQVTAFLRLRKPVYDKPVYDKPAK